MQNYQPQYLPYLAIEKNCSPLTIADYRLELEKFGKYIILKTSNLDKINITLVRSYIQTIKEDGIKNNNPDKIFH